MTVAVITAPPAVVTAAQAKAMGVFPLADDDAVVDMLLLAAQNTLEGPDGWLGRAVGVQTLEFEQRHHCGVWYWTGSQEWRTRLPYPPIRSVTSVKSISSDGTETTIEPANYSLARDWLVLVASAPASSWLRIRYAAGYDDVPQPIRYAIMLMAAQMRASAGVNGQFITREDVVGVGSTSYADAAARAGLVQGAAESLLSTYRVLA